MNKLLYKSVPCTQNLLKEILLNHFFFLHVVFIFQMGVGNDGDDDGDLSQYEADLAALMGGEVTKDNSNKNPKKECLNF